MYKQFFGLRENPFHVTPDPRYLFLTPSASEALAGLTYGIHSRRGILLLTGEVGTGKTTLLNRLQSWLRQRKAATATIFNTALTTSELFDCVLADFEIACASRAKSDILLQLNRWLLDRYHAGEAAVLIVDEAQNLSPALLEEIRLLTNLETSTEKLLQIVLSGQPELEDKLKQADLRQLRQRITVHCKTRPLSLTETQGYIAQRLRIAGANGEPIFTAEAMDRIHDLARGIPRVINVLCEHALVYAFVQDLKPVPLAVIEEVSQDCALHCAPVAPPVAEASALRASPAIESLLHDFARLLGGLQPPLIRLETGEGKR